MSSGGVLWTGAPARVATSASPVASMTRRARIASRPALDSVTMPMIVVAVHQRGDELAVQHRVDARLLDKSVGDQLEAFGVEFVGQRLAFGYRRAHLLGALLELPADAAGLHRLLAAVPGEALDADRGDVSPEAAEPLDQGHPHTGARRRQGGGEAARARPTTSTSVSWMTSISRLGSVTVRGCAGMVRHLNRCECPFYQRPEGVSGTAGYRRAPAHTSRSPRPRYATMPAST